MAETSAKTIKTPNRLKSAERRKPAIAPARDDPSNMDK
jgi:hypothetical protein